jgi:hypothetical protein
MRVFGPQHADRLHPVSIRELEIGNQQVDGVFVQGMRSFRQGAAGGQEHAAAPRADDGGKALPDRGIVLDQKDAAAGRFCQRFSAHICPLRSPLPHVACPLGVRLTRGAFQYPELD